MRLATLISVDVAAEMRAAGVGCGWLAACAVAFTSLPARNTSLLSMNRMPWQLLLLLCLFIYNIFYIKIELKLQQLLIFFSFGKTTPNIWVGWMVLIGQNGLRLYRAASPRSIFFLYSLAKRFRALYFILLQQCHIYSSYTSIFLSLL